MKNGTLIGAACGALVVGAVWTGVQALTQYEDSQEMSPEMAAWMKASAPGAQHKLLATLVGDWNIVAEFKMDPDAPPTTDTGTNVNTMTFGGRFLKSDYTSTFMGATLNGTSYIGYDNVEQHYVSIWISDMGTGLTLDYGQCNAAGTQWTMKGAYNDPMGNAIKYKHVLTIVSEDEYTFEMYSTQPDIEGMYQNGTITYTRSN